jgi:hypothetical protein
VLEHLESPGFHPVEHVHQTGFYTDRLVLELRVLVQHVHTLRPILVSERNPRAFQRFPTTVTGPGPGNLAPRAQCRSVQDR